MAINISPRWGESNIVTEPSGVAPDPKINLAYKAHLPALISKVDSTTLAGHSVLLSTKLTHYEDLALIDALLEFL